MKTTNEEIDQIAREACHYITNAAHPEAKLEYFHSFSNRIAALRVKESGAVEALEANAGSIYKRTEPVGQCIANEAHLRTGVLRAAVDAAMSGDK